MGIFFIFDFFLKLIQTFFFEQIISFQKNCKVFTQLRIVQKEIKSTLNQEQINKKKPKKTQKTIKNHWFFYK
jgi:hypothetical protein